MGRVELIEKRDRYSKTFDNRDNTYTLEFATFPLHYMDGERNWQDISARFEEDAAAGQFRCLTNVLQVVIKRDVREDYNTVVKTDEGLTIEIDLREARYSTESGEFETVHYPNDTSYTSYAADDATVVQAGVFPGITDRYCIGSGILKHDLVIEQAPLPPSITGSGLKFEVAYRIRVNKPVKVTTQDIEKAIDFVTTEDITFSPLDGSEFAVRLRNVNIRDQAGIYAVVEQRLRFITETEFELAYLVSYDFLIDDTLVYPLVIDPTSQTVSVSIGSPGGTDQKTFYVGFPQTMQWSCYVHGHASTYTYDYGCFGIYDPSGATIVYKEQGGNAGATYSGSINVTSSQIGNWTVKAWTTNEYSSASGSVTYQINRAPTCSCSSPTGGAWQKSSSVTLSWSYSDADGDPIQNSRIQVARDSGFSNIVKDVYPGAVTSYNCTGLAEGIHYWRVSVYDGIVWSGWCSPASFNVDTVLPSFVSASISGHRYNSGNDYWVRPNDIVHIRHRGYDGGSGIRYHYLRANNPTDEARIEATANNEWEASTLIDLNGAGAPTEIYNSGGYREYEYHVMVISDGYDHNMEGFYYDVAGNGYGYFSLGIRLRVDGGAPSISGTSLTVDSPTLDSQQEFTATVAWSITDSRSGVQKTSLAFYYNGTWYYDNASLPDGITCSVDMTNIAGAGAKMALFYNIPDNANIGIAWRGYDNVGNDTGWVGHTYLTTPNRVPIGHLKLKVGSGIVAIGVYPLTIMSNTILRMKLNDEVGCFWLVSPSHVKATPLRIHTHKGTFSIAKEQ